MFVTLLFLIKVLNACILSRIFAKRSVVSRHVLGTTVASLIFGADPVSRDYILVLTRQHIFGS